MPFKVRGVYYTELVLPGYGKLRRKSLGTRRLTDARAIEAAIKEVHRRGLHDPRLFVILDALQGQGKGAPGVIDPADVLVAVKADGDGVARLARSIDDPPFADIAAEYLERAEAEGFRITASDRRSVPVLTKHVGELFGKDAPFSTVAEASAVEAVLRSILAEGGKRGSKTQNGVVRHEKNTLAKILTFRLGRFERRRILADVQFGRSDHRRMIRPDLVTPEAIRRLCDELAACYYHEGDEAAPVLVRVAVATGAAVSPLMKTRNRDWRPLPSGGGLLHLSGTKKARKTAGGAGSARDRDLRLAPPLAALVRPFWREDDPDALLFGLGGRKKHKDRYKRFYKMWEKAVARAGLTEAVLNGRREPTPLRPHDLRRAFAAFGREAGLREEVIGYAGLGHDDLGTTESYARRAVTMSDQDAAKMAALVAGPLVGGSEEEHNPENKSRTESQSVSLP